MANVGSLFVVLGLKASDYQEGLRKATKEANTAMRNIKREFASLDMKAAVVGAAALTTAFAYAGKKFADAASEAEINKRRFDAVFGDMANSAGLWVDDLSSKIGRSNDDVRGWIAGIQQMLVNMGIGADKANAMSKRMVELGVDIGSMFGANDADVMMALQKALAGQARGLMQYGIVLKGVTQTDEEGNQVLNDKVSKMTNIQKVYTMYNALLEQTANIQGDATRNMNTYGNQLKRLQGNVQDVRQEIGARLSPAITDVYQKMNEWLQDSSNVDKMKEWGNAAATLTKQMADLATGIASHKDTVVLLIEAMFGAWAVNKLAKFSTAIFQIANNLKALIGVIKAAGVVLSSFAALTTAGILVNVKYAYENAKVPERQLLGGQTSEQMIAGYTPRSALKNQASIFESANFDKKMAENEIKFPLAVMPKLENWKPPTANIFADLVKPQIDASETVKDTIQKNDKETFDFWKKMAKERRDYDSWFAERKMNEAEAELAADQDHAKQLVEAEQARANRFLEIRIKLADDQKKRMEQEQAIIDRQKDAWISFGDTIANTMMYAMMQSGNAFRNIAKSFGDMLTNMAAQYAARAVIFSFLKAVAPTSWGLPSLKNLVFGDLFRANGGDIDAYHPAIVGERGPEIIIPKTASTIIPNNEIPKMNNFQWEPRNEYRSIPTPKIVPEIIMPKTAGMVTNNSTVNDNSRWELHFHDSDSRQKMAGLPDDKFAEQFKKCVRDGRITVKRLA